MEGRIGAYSAGIIILDSLSVCEREGEERRPLEVVKRGTQTDFFKVSYEREKKGEQVCTLQAVIVVQCFSIYAEAHHSIHSFQYC